MLYASVQVLKGSLISSNVKPKLFGDLEATAT